MGLDFSHTDVNWMYSKFNNFRRRLAKEIDIILDEMEGFGGDIPFSNYNDDILPLLNHSDRSGELTVDECKQVAPRLRELVSGWEDDDIDKRKALRLADGMEYAVKCGEPLQFL